MINPQTKDVSRFVKWVEDGQLRTGRLFHLIDAHHGAVCEYNRKPDGSREIAVKKYSDLEWASESECRRSTPFLTECTPFIAEVVAPADKISDLLTTRHSTHGEYLDNSRNTQQTMRLWSKAPNWEKLTDDQKESLHMIGHKVSRILCGDPEEPDHWDDIAGYAKLSADRARRRRAEAPRKLDLAYDPEVFEKR